MHEKDAWMNCDIPEVMHTTASMNALVPGVPSKEPLTNLEVGLHWQHNFSHVEVVYIPFQVQ